jgi:hypothetical protein
LNHGLKPRGYLYLSSSSYEQNTLKFPPVATDADRGMDLHLKKFTNF